MPPHTYHLHVSHICHPPWHSLKRGWCSLRHGMVSCALAVIHATVHWCPLQSLHRHFFRMLALSPIVLFLILWHVPRSLAHVHAGHNFRDDFIELLGTSRLLISSCLVPYTHARESCYAMPPEQHRMASAICIWAGARALIKISCYTRLDNGTCLWLVCARSHMCARACARACSCAMCVWSCVFLYACTGAHMRVRTRLRACLCTISCMWTYANVCIYLLLPPDQN